METIRIGDAERDSAVALLSEQYALGRLSKEEFDERSDAAWSARTRGDLSPLFTDLPVGRAGAAPPERRRRRSRVPVPLMALLLVLVAVTVLTHLPIILLALVLWIVGRRQWDRRWDRHSTSMRA
ncbi:MAG: DUF1707 domain-containing protein [Marmoricola sp.]